MGEVGEGMPAGTVRVVPGGGLGQLGASGVEVAEGGFVEVVFFAEELGDGVVAEAGLL